MDTDTLDLYFTDAAQDAIVKAHMEWIIHYTGDHDKDVADAAERVLEFYSVPLEYAND